VPAATTEKPKAKPAPRQESEHVPPTPEYQEITTAWGLGELHDLGPAGPTTASRQGVYFVTRNDQLLLAPRKQGELFQPVSAPKQAFAKYGRGPSLSETHAYWVSEKGVLLRGDLRTLKVEQLYKQARPGTRTSVQTAAGRDVVAAFVAQIGEDPMAYAWISAGSQKPELHQISPDGSTATSVTLVAGSPHPRAVVLEGRTSMSPVHVRRLRTTKRRVTLEPDEVVWIGPGSHVLTEIRAIGQDGDHCVAFLPTSKDFHDFGLAQLDISSDGGECPEPHWQIYPNGLDPAPVFAANICGSQHVLYARPSEARPRSPQALHLAHFTDSGPGAGEVIARSRAFNDVSMAAIRGGAVISWTADKRTWGMRITCPVP